MLKHRRKGKRGKEGKRDIYRDSQIFKDGQGILL